MSRPLRYNQADALFHVTSRGNEQQDIVRTDADRLTFVERLARVVVERRWILHSWVLMTNHLHLLVTTPVPNLSDGMRDLLGEYARRFNTVHGRVGHLFQHRFDAKPVERERHLLELSRYLPLNPVRCGLVKTPAEWPWSSYRATAGFEPIPVWLDPSWVLAQFHPTSRRTAHLEFRDFVSRGREVEYDPWSETTSDWVLGSPEFCQEIQSWIDTKPRSAEHPRRQQQIALPRFDMLISIVKREFRLSDDDLRRRRRTMPRKLIADLGHDDCGQSFVVIAECLGTTPWGASKLRARSRQLLNRDREYSRHLRRIRLALQVTE